MTSYTNFRSANFTDSVYYTAHKYIYISVYMFACKLVMIIIIINERRMTSSTTANRIEERRVTSMLLGIIALFLVCYTPPSLTYIAQTWTRRNLTGFVFTAVSDIISQVNFALNLFVHCCCSQTFCSSLLGLFSCFREISKPDVTVAGRLKTLSSSAGKSSSDVSVSIP